MSDFIYNEDDMFKPFLEHEENMRHLECIDYIVVTVTENSQIFQQLELVLEGAWLESKEKGWSYHLDPQRPKEKLQRHIHIAKTKRIHPKTNQFSWNQDGTRHDKKTFCKSEKGIETAKRIASSVLGMPAAIFESANPPMRPLFLTESAILGNHVLPEHTMYLTSYVGWYSVTTESSFG